MHVHVGIESREEGVGVIDRLRPWLPVVLALSVNSPFVADARHRPRLVAFAGLDAGGPPAGATELFGLRAGVRRAGRDLVATGAARDPGMLYFERPALARSAPPSRSGSPTCAPTPTTR